jgi:hypothetical protein
LRPVTTTRCSGRCERASASVVGQQFAAAFAAGHQQRDRRVRGKAELFAQLGLGFGDVLELRMYWVAELENSRTGDAAFACTFVDFAGRYDDRVDFGDEPALVHAAEVGDHGQHRDVRHPRVGPRAQRGVVEQRMHRDDHVGAVFQEQVLEAFAR